MTKKIQTSVVMIAVVVFAIAAFASVFCYMTDVNVKKTLKTMAEWPQLRNAVTTFFTHYNDEDYAYLYQIMVSDEIRGKVPKEDFVKNISDIRAKTGRVRDAKLFSGTFEGKTSYATKESSASYTMSYFLACDKIDSLCQMLLVDINSAWHIENFEIQYSVSKELRKKIEYYTSTQAKLDL